MRNQIKTLLQIGWLFLRDLITLRLLEIQDFKRSRFIIANTTYSRIEWNAQGCFAVLVSGRLYPGNIHGLNIKESRNPKDVTLTFYGFNRKRSIILEVPSSDINFQHQFRASSLPTKLSLPAIIIGSFDTLWSMNRVKPFLPFISSEYSARNLVVTGLEVEYYFPDKNEDQQ